MPNDDQAWIIRQAITDTFPTWRVPRARVTAEGWRFMATHPLWMQPNRSMRLVGELQLTVESTDPRIDPLKTPIPTNQAYNCELTAVVRPALLFKHILPDWSYRDDADMVSCCRVLYAAKGLTGSLPPQLQKEIDTIQEQFDLLWASIGGLR